MDTTVSKNLKIRCPVCNHDYVSLAKIDGRLPGEVQQFFTPFPTQIEQMFAASHFQYCALVEKINSQSNLVDRLVQKINKQKSLLLLAKEKVGQVDEMENKIKQLERENHMLKSTSLNRSTRESPRPETIDLTANDSIDRLPGMDQRNVVTRSFVNQIKQSSTQRSLPSGSSRQNTQSNYESHQNQNNRTFDLTKGKMAESTNILGHSPISKYAYNPNSMGSHGISTPTSHSSHQIMSNGSYKSSDSSRTPEPFLQPVSTNFTAGNNQRNYPQQQQQQQQQPVSHGLSSSGKLTGARVTKNRASTSQLAQRLSAHMKIGKGTSLMGLRGQTSGGIRPGSSFNQGSMFKKR
ncbi:Cortactin-binding protein [Wickerhamomyces ciferrii]|uniref:Cortactin-binding protein n=1 Tax=Wickerhamomyces ciferrii (strain ATCC 14091 / BCRC 22168 / CBS 111 / JCM 3599 / NBRC 0793 / NRRL Y-1031 F-60-10) TaxID=1206466 RepID=K0KXD3_WICCF|nr:Cortactin-binding protein [Wickerhamomyces ciferrii]CCH46144.1 Cortactin-binding protein [Wickerhamomyces ciferrii]